MPASVPSAQWLFSFPQVPDARTNPLWSPVRNARGWPRLSCSRTCSRCTWLQNCGVEHGSELTGMFTFAKYLLVQCRRAFGQNSWRVVLCFCHL